jgi:putative ATPase
MAFFDALKEVEREDAEVPNHLRDASRDAEGFGHGEGYIYPHAYRDHWAAQQYLPTALRGRAFYMPSQSGYEGKIRDEVQRKRELQTAIILGETESEGELLSWSPSGRGREGWYKRLESGRSAVLLADRDALLGAFPIKRHDRILIPYADDGLLLWESLRRVPEGLCAALVSSETAKEALNGSMAMLEETEKPLIGVFPQSAGEPAAGMLLPGPAELETLFGVPEFDHIVLREPWRRIGSRAPAFSGTAAALEKLLCPGGKLAILASPPSLGQRISGLLKPFVSRTCPEKESLLLSLEKAEEAFFSPEETLFSSDVSAAENPEKYWTWNAEILEKALENAGFTVSGEVLSREEERPVGPENLNSWFDPAVSSWGAHMKNVLGEEAFAELKTLLGERITQGTITWRWKSLLVKGVKRPS